MRQKAQQAADDRAIVNAPLAAGQQARAKAQCHKGDEVVADDGGPVNGELVADEVGDGAVHQARQRAPAAAVPGGEQDDGQHLQGDGAAVGELIELDEAEDLRHGDEDGSLTDHACFADFHVFFSSVKKYPHRGPRRRHNADTKRYGRIPTPALPGSGLRDRTAIRRISAGLRQHPLDCDKILSCPVIFVKI